MTKKKHKNRIKIITPVLILVLLGLGLFWHWHYGTKNTVTNSVKTAATTTTSTTVKSDVSTKSPSTISYSAPSDNGQPTVAEQPTTGTPPTAPSGEFISNYSAGSSSAERSVCDVQPGVSCTISFTQDGITQSLGIGVAGSDGFVLWNWEPSDLQLTTGAWRVKATATINNLSSTTNDPNLLNIQ